MLVSQARVELKPTTKVFQKTDKKEGFFDAEKYAEERRSYVFPIYLKGKLHSKQTMEFFGYGVPR